MKKSIAILGSGLLATSIFIFAQQGVAPVPANNRKTVNEQARQIFRLIDPLAQAAGKSTVNIFNQQGRVCYGISIGEEKVIAKWSDLIGRGPIFASQGDDTALNIEPLGYYADQDLVVLKVSGLTAPAIVWGTGEALPEGRMLIPVNAEGKSISLGVVSVGVRNLREADEGFLGVVMDMNWKGAGIRVRQLEPKGAAEAAGLQVGDVVTTVAGDQIDGLIEMMTRIRRYKAGEVVDLLVRRDDAELKISPKLKGFDVRKMPESPQLRRMDEMSGGLSRVRDGFPSAIQSDMELEPNDSGAPVVDLDGKVVGMVIARAARVSTLILPAEEIQRVLKTEFDAAEQLEIASQKVMPEENRGRQGERFRNRRQNVE